MSPNPNPLRGEIWMVNFDPQIGHEIKKSRPAVVVNLAWEQIFPLRLVIPITEWQPSFQGRITKVRVDPTPLNGLHKSSALDLYQIKSASLMRFSRKLGQLEAITLETAAKCVAALIKAV